MILLPFPLSLQQGVDCLMDLFDLLLWDLDLEFRSQVGDLVLHSSAQSCSHSNYPSIPCFLKAISSSCIHDGSVVGHSRTQSTGHRRGRGLRGDVLQPGLALLVYGLSYDGGRATASRRRVLRVQENLTSQQGSWRKLTLLCFYLFYLNC